MQQNLIPLDGSTRRLTFRFERIALFSAIVGPFEVNDSAASVEFSRDRFLEYTDDAIKAQLHSLSDEARQSLMSWPCLVFQEGRGDGDVVLARILSISVTAREIRLTMRPCAWTQRVLNADLFKIREALDLEQFEFNRYHWAVKDQDLFAKLAAFGYEFDAEVADLFSLLPLPAPSRAKLLEAKNAIADLSHTEIDDLLLHAGVQGLVVINHLEGSRRDRAIAIVEFSLSNPSAITAENSLFSAYLVRSVLKPTETSEIETELEDSTTTMPVPVQSRRTSTERGREPNRVFVVHGRNEIARRSVTDFLASLSLNAIVLHEQASMGRHLLTKLIHEADLVTFAVVLLTDDDVGGESAQMLRPRARQNVILELGYFLAHLGQEKVCVLKSPELETPSDFDGIVYIAMDAQDAWKAELRRELSAAGMPIHLA